MPPVCHNHILVQASCKCALVEDRGAGDSQVICQGSILLDRDQVIARMCHGSSRTSKTQEEVDRSSNCHRFVVSDTFQMKELSETSFENIHGSLRQPQSVQCLEPWSR